jgi:hypothetical protein
MIISTSNTKLVLKRVLKTFTKNRRNYKDDLLKGALQLARMHQNFAPSEALHFQGSLTHAEAFLQPDVHHLTPKVPQCLMNLFSALHQNHHSLLPPEVSVPGIKEPKKN